jgi:hypothetical protein
VSVINKIVFLLSIVTVGPYAQQACQILQRAEFAKLIKKGGGRSHFVFNYLAAKLQELHGSHE